MIGLTKEMSGRTKRKRSERSCIVCGKKESAEELLRVIVTKEKKLAIDPRRHLGGRGAYVCESRKCVVDAIEKKKFERTLRTEVVYPDSTDFLQNIQSMTRRSLATLFSSGLGARVFAIGTDAVNREIKKKKVFLLMVATDAARAERFLEKANGENIEVRLLFDKQQLGEFLNCRATGIVAVLDGGFASAFADAISRFEALY